MALVARAIDDEDIECRIGDVDAAVELNYAISHLMCMWEGINDRLDIPWLARAMGRIMAVRAAELRGTLLSDIIPGDGLHVIELNAKAAAILDSFDKCETPFTHLKPGTTGKKVYVSLIDPQPPWHMLPWRVVMETALGMMEGGIKYGRHNYRGCGVRCTVYYDATMRHIADYLEGTVIDKDSGMSHLSKALSSSQVMLDSMIMGNWIDDRPIRIK
jgi:hypothetical protein